jgi:hypothetical protein
VVLAAARGARREDPAGRGGLRRRRRAGPRAHADLGPLFARGLEQVGAAIVALLSDADAGRPPLLVRGGVSALPGVREWLAARTGCALAASDDPGAAAPAGQVCGAAAWTAARAGLGR